MSEIPQKHHRLSREIIISIVAFTITVAIMVFYFLNPGIFRQFGQLEYLGLFLIGLLAGSVTLIPVPGIVTVFALGSVLFPPFVGIVYGLGEAISSIPIYYEGHTGKGLIKKMDNRIILKFEEWLQKRGVAAVIFMSAIINPLYMPFTLLAGMMNFGVVKFVLLSFLGKTIKNTAIAYLGFFGLGAILRMMGVPV